MSPEPEPNARVEPVALPDWPGGREVAVSLTFDVDGEAGVLGEGPEQIHRLTSMSAGRFGTNRGIHRILELLADNSIPGTFYVPGYTAEKYPDLIREIAAAGHEIGHHGYLHKRTVGLDAASQADEIRRGVDAIVAAIGRPPTGYRSPYWELTPETKKLLISSGFQYDSSGMGDDRPYVDADEHGSILEFPVHWSLDDHPFFGWSSERGGLLAPARQAYDIWAAEFEHARTERRHVTYTMHPEVIGRGYCFAALRDLVTTIVESRAAWFATHDSVSRLILDASDSESTR